MRGTSAAAQRTSIGPEVEPAGLDAIKDRKLWAAAGDVFKELQTGRPVVIVYNDPVKSKQMPGIAATINGQKITLVELAEESIERHGNDVLEGAVNRRTLGPGPANGICKTRSERDQRRNRPRGRDRLGTRPRPKASPTSRAGWSTSPDREHFARSLCSRRSLAVGGAQENRWR